ncbi:MAG: hypothetical protein JWO03_3316 [Bacteroidetes bacterium]|nr:hypothetical protein [Bacteroidota bacterium]
MNRNFKWACLILWMLIFMNSCKQRSDQRLNTVVSTSAKQSTDSGSTFKIIAFHTPFKFEDFTVKIYKGKLAAPRFDSSEFANDKEYVKFITDGCQENNINFAGHYTIIEKSCGAECQFIFIVDRISGRIIEDLCLDGNMHGDTCLSDGRYGYRYYPNSLMLMTNTELFTDSAMSQYYEYYCKPEIYKWSDGHFTKLQ